MTQSEAQAVGFCECCGADKYAAVRAPSGGHMAACDDCKRDAWTQHAIDIKSYQS